LFVCCCPSGTVVVVFFLFFCNFIYNVDKMLRPLKRKLKNIWKDTKSDRGGKHDMVGKSF